MAAEFVYPQYGNYSIVSKGQDLNTYDTLYVQYRTSWPKVNVTLFCLQWNATSGKPYFYNSPYNPSPPSGLYSLGTIQEIGYWDVFPTSCRLRLTHATDNTTNLDGEIWWITSIANKAATTFSPTASATSTASLTQTTPPSTSANATPVSSASSSSSIVTPTTSSSDLSTGAKAGIGIGVALAVVAILAMIAFFLFTRRRRSKADRGPLETTSSVHSNEKTRPAQIGYGYKPAGKQEMEDTGLYEADNTGFAVHELDARPKA